MLLDILYLKDEEEKQQITNAQHGLHFQAT